MRVSRQQQDRNRAKLVKAAARLVRRHGVGGVGVDRLAKAARVTHGAVYSQFPGKDALAAAAIAQSMQETSTRWRSAAEQAGSPGSPDYFNELVRHYVSRAHRDRPEMGCAVAALACDATRHGRAVRAAIATHIAVLATFLESAMPDAQDTDPTDAALAAMATMVGAVVLARGVDDPALSDRILLAARRSVMRAPRG